MTDLKKATAYSLLSMAKDNRLLFWDDDNELHRVFVFDEDDPDGSGFFADPESTDAYCPVRFEKLNEVEKLVLFDPKQLLDPEQKGGD